ncbi:MAG: hypothetical protein AB1542_11935 [Pseudomonadota bacterium]|jgi:hypothetical protein
MKSPQHNNLGAKSPKAVAAYLKLIGDHDAADRVEALAAGGQALNWPWGDDVWGYTGILMGYIAPEDENNTGVIQNAVQIQPDTSLRDSRIKIALERFWVSRYPGAGTHEILCEFTGKNQIAGEAEEMRFTLKTSAKNQSSAAVMGAPIFLGASVGKNGIAFEGKTINVRSNTDDELLSALESGPFKQGLTLLTVAQPALKPFVGLAGSLVGAVLKRSENKQIYWFKLGLDFNQSQTSAKLRHGSYVVVQGDQSNWSWDAVKWDAGAQQVVTKADNKPIPFNYLIFRVSPFEADT